MGPGLPRHMVARIVADFEVGHRARVLQQADGHDFHGPPGVYCSKKFATAAWYARSHNVFEDGVFYRVVLELRVNRAEKSFEKDKGGQQIVVPTTAVSIQGIHILCNSPPAAGEDRLAFWSPRMEALPPGAKAVRQ